MFQRQYSAAPICDSTSMSCTSLATSPPLVVRAEDRRHAARVGGVLKLADIADPGRPDPGLDGSSTNASAGIFGRLSRAARAVHLVGGRATLRSMAIVSGRLPIRTCTSAGGQADLAEEVTQVKMHSASASTSSLPITSMFHWKNSRSRPFCGFSARNSRGMLNHLIAAGAS